MSSDSNSVSETKLENIVIETTQLLGDNEDKEVKTENNNSLEEQEKSQNLEIAVKTIATILLEMLLNEESIKNAGIEIDKSSVFSFEKSSPENSSLYTLRSDKFIVSTILSLVKSNPNIFIEIETIIRKILSDNKVDISDLPELLSIQKKLIELIYNVSSLKINKNNIPEVVSNILKFLIRVLLKENLITVSNNEQFLINFDKLVDTITELSTLLNTLHTPCCTLLNLFRSSKKE
jgi:hypothetical protein